MSTKVYKTLVLIGAMLLLAACNTDNIDSCVDENITTTKSNVKLNISVDSFGAGTASTRADSDNDGILAEVNNLLILRFEGVEDAAVLSNSFYYDSEDLSEVIDMEVYGSYTTTVFVFIANGFGEISVASGITLGDFKSMGYTVNTSTTYTTDDGTIYADGLITQDANGQRYFVMSDSFVFDIGVRADTDIDVEFKRNLAKVSIKVTNNTEYDITNLSIRSMPSTSLYYSNQEGELDEDEESINVPTSVGNTVNYTLSDEDSLIQKDGSITRTYFVPVNMRGVVDECTDATDKAKYAPSGATYVYVTIPNIDGEDGEYYAYRFYLGADETNDYNLEANKQYDYEFTFNSLGSVETDSRVTLMGVVTLVTNDFTTLKSSNCYILNPSENLETYYIPIASRINEYWGGGYADVSDNCIADGDDSSWDYEVLWYDNDDNPINSNIEETELSLLGEDQIYIYKCLKGSSDNTPSLAITLGAGFDNWGNILVAVKKNGVIIWSWHLWITDYNPYNHGLTDLTVGAYPLNNGTGALHRYNDTAGYTVWGSGGIYEDKYIMDRNVGARSVTPLTTDGILYYQFGRKDPFPYSGMKNSDGTTLSRTTASATSLMSTVIQNPTTYYYGNTAWCTESKYVATTILWCDPALTDTSAGEKSIFDPSPYGFRVPIYYVWNNFSTSTFVVNSYAREVAGRGSYYNGNEDIYYPACGYVVNSTGDNGTSNLGPWDLLGNTSSTPSTSTHAYMLYAGNSTTGAYQSQNTFYRTSGLSLRCIEDVEENED